MAPDLKSPARPPSKKSASHSPPASTFSQRCNRATFDVDRAAASIEFSFAIGANYFFQIAKFRAFRMLWASAVESFGRQMQTCAQARIHARTSRWNKTIYDPHVNMLRATTEAMSAVLGGADSISVAAFDECYKTAG